MSDMVRFAMKGDLKHALPLHYRLLPLMNAIFEEGNPTGIKALLSIQNGMSDHVRLPLVAASEGLKHKLSKLLEAYENSDFR